MKYTILFLLVIGIHLNAQNPILVHNLFDGTQQEIPQPNYDETITSDKTLHFIGNYNTEIQELEQTFPTANTYPDSQYTFKKKASDDYDITKYPIRASVRLFEYDEIGGERKNNCSGIFISKKHVLTAAHCVSNSNNVLNVLTMSACPIYNDGLESTFGCSEVKKIYVFKDYDINSEDFAILELDEPIGASTGWVSIGFNDNDTVLPEELYYRFSYPNENFPTEPDNNYDGGTLYYNYGKIDLITQNTIGVANTSGIPGESGTSYLQVKNNESYMAIASTTWANSLQGSRLTSYKYYALQNIIKDDLILSVDDTNLKTSFSITPNPTSGNIFVKNNNYLDILKLKILDTQGRIVLENDNFRANNTLDLSSLFSGLYFLSLKTDTSLTTIKIIKN